VSDIRKFSRLTGWQPRVSLASGVVQLGDWLRSVVEGQHEEQEASWQALANGALGSHGADAYSAGNGAAQ
jgi:hypothetical protein